MEVRILFPIFVKQLNQILIIKKDIMENSTFVIVKKTDPYNSSKYRISTCGEALSIGTKEEIKSELFSFACQENNWIEVDFDNRNFAVCNDFNHSFEYNEEEEAYISTSKEIEYEGMEKGDLSYNEDIWNYSIISLEEAKENEVDLKHIHLEL